ncbi:hypothetical protein [Tenacibaculum sp. M341]|nr:hypothetical protein [Tenacibaculum sp. M341]
MDVKQNFNTRVTYYKTGAIKSKAQYQNNKVHGTLLKYSLDGNLMSSFH